MKWTPELLATVKDLCHQGYTNAQIADKLTQSGNYVTKSGVKHIATKHAFDRGGRVSGDNGLIKPDGQLPRSDKSEEHVEQDIDYNDDETIKNARITYRYMSFRDKKKKTPKQILKYAGYDPDKWTLISAHPNEWTVTAANEAPKWNFQFKISIKPKTSTDLSPDDLIKLFNEKIEPIILPTSHDCSISGDTLLIAWADLHFPITTFEGLQEKILEYGQILKRGYKKVIISQLGDLFQSDSMWYSRTANETDLGGEYDMKKAISDAQKLFDVIIRQSLLNANTVEIRQIAGNHSRDLEYMFMEYLKARYPQVEVFNNIKYREAFMIDNNMVMQLHGDLAINKAPQLMAVEYPDMWAKAKHRFIFSGHFHKLKEGFTDDDGVFTAQLGTVKSSDSWEKSKGLTMTDKELYAFEFNSDKMIAEYHI
ncbi:MAG: hypothetical protein ABF899_01615 [Oenococcus sp.]|uniref:hypothetical protein n=1 Tax=Oenococcus sp. TaxID=1979414 RepID=UPI0039ED7F66